jgi:pyruvate kinase
MGDSIGAAVTGTSTEDASEEAMDAAMSFAACQLSVRTGARAIVISVRSVAAALEIARFRPQVPLVMITDSLWLYRRLALVHGIAPFFSDASLGDQEQGVAQAGEWLFAQRLAKPGDPVVLLSASTANGEKADALRVVRLAV